MAKLSYIYLVFNIHACVLFRSAIFRYNWHAPDYSIDYYRLPDKQSYNRSCIGERLVESTLNFYVHEMERKRTVEPILFKITIKNDFLTGKFHDYGIRMNLRQVNTNKYYTYYLLPRDPISLDIERTFFHDSFLSCNLYRCQIGLYYLCSSETDVKLCSYFRRAIEFVYIGFVKSDEYDNLVLQLIPKIRTNKEILSVITCPGPTWLREFSYAQYIQTWENLIQKAEFSEFQIKWTLKFAYCHDISIKTFIKCGTLKQKFLPQIDVGYQCDDYNKVEALGFFNYDEKPHFLSTTGTELVCNDNVVYKEPRLGIAILPPGSNYDDINGFKIRRLHHRNTSLYAGDRLHIVNPQNLFDKKKRIIESSLGFVINYKPKCKVPTINATLRLRINNIVQGFDNKIDKKFGKKDIYTFASKEIKNSSIGCHIVLHRFEHPAFKDFYGLLYSTSLLMLDETTKKYIKVDGIQNLVSNRVYKCALITKGNNSKIEKPDYIKETEFIINLIGEDSFNTWIIFVIFIIFIVLLIIGLVVYKRLQLKKKKTDDSLSTSSSMSSSQSTTKSSTVISEVSNVPIIQNKSFATKFTKMGKTMVTKNTDINNKLTSPGQKVAANNPNLNLINQAKNAPKKVSGKNSNQKKINSKEDSVFKVK